MKQGRLPLASILAIALLTACSSGAQSVASTTRTEPPATPAAPAALTGVLVFQAGSPPNYHFTLTSSEGAVLKTLDTTAGIAPGMQGDSAALLLYGANKTHAVLAQDGSVTPLPTALEPAFDNSTGEGIGSGAGDPILLDPSTALGVKGYANSTYELVDLKSGQITALVSATTTNPTSRGIMPPTLVPAGVSRDHHTARLLVRHAIVNGTTVPQLALIEIDLRTKTVSRLKQLPLFPSGLNADDVFEPALSTDGRLLAYQENSKADPQNVAIYTTHVVDIETGRDLTISDTSTQLIGNSRGLRFAPDGSALVAYGISAGPSIPQHSKLSVFATSDGHSLFNDDVGDGEFSNVQPAGWVGDHTPVITTTTTTVPGNFTNGTQAASLVDVSAGQQFSLPYGFGELVAVLN